MEGKMEGAAAVYESNEKKTSIFRIEGVLNRFLHILKWHLAQKNLLIDVFIQSEHIAEKRRDNPGFLTHYALKEGAEL